MSEKYAVPNKLPGKTVSVLTHRKRRITQQKTTVEQKKASKTKRIAKSKQHHKFRRAESFVMAYLKAERTAKRIKHTLLRTNPNKIPDANKTNKKLLLVLRHAGKKIFNKNADNICKSLQLTHRHHAVFIENTKENQLLLRIVEPFVVYGYPSLAIIRELVFKKGFAYINSRRTPIQSNALIEEHLGSKGIICLEDIIHEIFTVGPNFEAVNAFLCSFMLSSPRNGWKQKVAVPFKRGGEYGDRGEGINELVTRCI